MGNTPPLNEPKSSDIALNAPGVLMPLGLEGRGKNDAFFSTATYWLTVTCTLKPPVDLGGRIWRAHVHLRDLPNGLLEVETANRDDRLDPLDLISPSACRLPGVVPEFLRLAASIKIAPLRKLLSDVFTQSAVFEEFWTVPAAPDHHHWRGGLAWHTLEVLRGMDSAMARPSPRGKPWSIAERDLALVAAWLHDVAECIDHGQPINREIEARRHACAIRQHRLVADALVRLSQGHRDLANALLDLWYPGMPSQRGDLRVDAIRAVLLECHRNSELSTIRPMPNPYDVLFDRCLGVTRH